MKSMVVFLVLFFFHITLLSQTVRVSSDINIRNDYAYDLLGQIDENILLYRDEGFTQRVMAYDSLLEFKWERPINLEKKKNKIYGVVPQDSIFDMFYGYKEDGEELIKVGRFNPSIDRVDSLTLIKKDRNLLKHDFDLVVSEDKTKSMLYYIDGNDEMAIYVFDHINFKLSWQKIFHFKTYNLKRDLFDIVLTDSGLVLCLLELNNSRFKKDEHRLELFYLNITTNRLSLFDLGGTVSQDLLFSYDDKNQRIGIFGLYDEKSSFQSEGYFSYNENLNQIGDQNSVRFQKFDLSLMGEVYGSRQNKKDALENFLVTDLIWRNDGGFIAFTEMRREFTRRNGYGGVERASSSFYGFKGWTDYYHENILAFSIHPNGQDHWKEILYKKQFSQDDGGIYSSFFLFRTPSRLRLVFNDEIRSDNTVSEYILNGVGQSKRKSVLSTEYQKLSLRFRDAIQLSSDAMLIPSQRNNNLSLVKISY